MNRLALLLCLCAAALMQGCASLAAGAGVGTETGYAGAQRFSQSLRAGDQLQVPGSQYPTTTITSDGTPVTMLAPTGNIAVVVNPDGTHSLTLLNGSTATIITR